MRAFKVTPSPGSSLTSKTVPLAGPLVVLRRGRRYCCARPMRTARSSGTPSPVLALVGTIAAVFVKSAILSKRSVLNSSLEKVPMIVYNRSSKSLRTYGSWLWYVVRKDSSGLDFQPGMRSILFAATMNGVFLVFRMSMDS